MLRAPGRLLVAFAIAIGVAASAIPVPVAAREAPRPLLDYEPTFVTERQAGTWRDCLWASSAMLLDKWTNGRTAVSRQRLRVLSGDLHGGSGLADVERAFAAIGFHLETSPHGGTSITWPILLDRLRHGGGAILLGDYSKLPRIYGRWDPRFWAGLPSRTTAKANAAAKAKARAAGKPAPKTKARPPSDHALYLDRYDSRTGRIFVMDPLAPAGWSGEWMPVSALKAFAWHSSWGLLSAAMTPAALPAPFAGVKIGGPTYAADATTLQIRWPIGSKPKGWQFTGAKVVTSIVRVAPSLAVGRSISAVAAQPGTKRRRKASVSGTRRSMTVMVPIPAPGVYRVSVTVKDRRYGHLVKATHPVTLYVPGLHWATYSVPSQLSALVTGTVHLSAVVTNAGVATWADPPDMPGLPEVASVARHAHLVGTWTLDQAPGASGAAPSGVPIATQPVDLGATPLAPGGYRTVDAIIAAPPAAGHWRLTLNVVDDIVGSYAAAGSAPAVIMVDVTPSADVTPHL